MKKLVQSGHTACLRPTLNVFRLEDRQLLQSHCHARALATLRAPPGATEEQTRLREAVAYLSLAIFAAGGSCPPPQGAQAPPGTQRTEPPSSGALGAVPWCMWLNQSLWLLAEGFLGPALSLMDPGRCHQVTLS